MKKKRIPLIVGIAVVALLLVWIIVSLVTSSGLPNLLIRNATAFDKDIPDPGFEGTSYEHIQYAEESDAEYLDLYVPDAEEAMPLLILVHGGGFVENDSQSRQAVLMYQYMRANGYAVATINYRLAQEDTFPAALSDVKAAVRYLRANAEEYGYDPDRFAIWGESAGGYLACMAALTGDDLYADVSYIGEDTTQPVSGEVSALIDFYGILDFDTSISDFEDCGVPRWLTSLMGMADVDSEDSVITQFLGANIATYTQEQLNAISPTYFAANLENQDLKVYIEHGSVDITVPRVQSERLYETLKDVLGDSSVTYREMKNFKHADDKFYTPENLEPVKEFLDQVFEVESGGEQ
ncbi:MAG: alpha/beta hydrolase [Clostridiales bacterium]|nr:alpha/beta hydrolase [Clostridiales bacterium]